MLSGFSTISAGFSDNEVYQLASVCFHDILSYSGDTQEPGKTPSPQGGATPSSRPSKKPLHPNIRAWDIYENGKLLTNTEIFLLEWYFEQHGNTLAEDETLSACLITLLKEFFTLPQPWLDEKREAMGKNLKAIDHHEKTYQTYHNLGRESFNGYQTPPKTYEEYAENLDILTDEFDSFFKESKSATSPKTNTPISNTGKSKSVIEVLKETISTLMENIRTNIQILKEDKENNKKIDPAGFDHLQKSYIELCYAQAALANRQKSFAESQLRALFRTGRQLKLSSKNNSMIMDEKNAEKFSYDVIILKNQLKKDNRNKRKHLRSYPGLGCVKCPVSHLSAKKEEEKEDKEDMEKGKGYYLIAIGPGEKQGRLAGKGGYGNGKLSMILIGVYREEAGTLVFLKTIRIRDEQDEQDKQKGSISDILTQSVRETKLHEKMGTGYGGYSRQGDPEANSLYDSFMELAEMDLIKFVNKLSIPFKIKEILKITDNCIRAVSSLHAAGYIHCDIKPENFVWKNGKIWLVDYGFSLHQSENHSHIIGTRNFISPEVRTWVQNGGQAVSEFPPYSMASDVYALGMALSNIFISRNNLDISQKALSMLSSKSRGIFIQIIKDMLHEDPAQRPSLARAQESLEKIEEFQMSSPAKEHKNETPVTEIKTSAPRYFFPPATTNSALPSIEAAQETITPVKQA